jgi:DNA polymerase-3 subunit chi
MAAPFLFVLYAMKRTFTLAFLHHHFAFSMTEIAFYHLTSTSLDDALPKLLEKAQLGGYRCVVRTATAEEAERLSNWLWQYTTDSFLAHGTAKDGFSALQPIYITAEEENPNASTLLMITSGIMPENCNGYSRVLDVFNGGIETELTSARSRWKEYSEAGHTLTYIKQNAVGGWEKQSL